MKKVEMGDYYNTPVYKEPVFCPDCEKQSQFIGDRSVGCEDCGDHTAIECTECGALFDHVWGFEEIDEYNKEKGIEIV